MNSPLVSVIMPAYNAQKYIAESIESVMNQTYTNWELIVIDDGSNDNTGNIIKQYKQQDARIKSISQQNSGQGNAKNAGIATSKGEYIAFLDADDLWLKEKLEVSVSALKAANVELLFTNYSVFNNELDVNKTTTMQVGNAIYKGREGIITFLNYNQIPNLTVLVKREAIISAGKFTDIKVAEDYEMWLRMLGMGHTFQSIAAPLSLYRMHDNSITAKDRHATFELIQIIKDFGSKNHGYTNEARKIAREKIKYWLYNGYDRTPKRFRALIKQVFPLHLAALFYSLSFLLPMRHLRKIVIRLY
ncbi:glycosyltransferase family 2 protein [Mucilaginibacter psychrotolerans]|nr:glycosyltransferase [Mucilaginibacter psychrotolerans]